MIIEQAAKQLAEAVKAMSEAIKDTDITSIYISKNGIDVHVLDKEVFKNIVSDQANLDWVDGSKEYCKMIKRMSGVNFYTLIKVDNTPAAYIPIPPDVAKKAMDLMKKEEATTC